MGKMQSSETGANPVHQSAMLHLETGHAQARCLIDAMNAIVGAQLGLARSAIGFMGSADPKAAFPVSTDGYRAFVASQAEAVRSIAEAGTGLARQTITLARAFADEQARQATNTFKI